MTSRARWLWTPVVAYLALIFVISSLPQAPLPPGVSDKSGHGIGYFGLGVLLVRALAGGLPARVRTGTAVLTVFLSVAYGISDEFHQSFVPGRSSDVHDVYADAVGASLGVATCWLWGIISRRPDV